LKLTITGVAPLLMHAYSDAEEAGLKNAPPKEQAEAHTYRLESGNLCIPQSNFMRALMSGAAYSKGKGRASLQKVVAAAVWLAEPEMDLGVKDFVVDSKSVVIPATRGRIMRHRARLNKWTASATLNYDETLISENQLRKIAVDTGALVGLMDFRPEKKGPFGRFTVAF
jgi:hypothetical protein